MLRKVGSIAMVLILALCTAGAAVALPLDPEAAEASAEETGPLFGLWSWLLDWIDRMGGREDGLSPIWQQDGCHIDPNGGCLPNN
jgi:hypothetical protein